MQPLPPIRIGSGYDIHRIIRGRPLMLGGVHIPWEYGLDGHSDADVLLHAVIDALLGALALDDIGQWFPNTDPAWRNAASGDLLRKILQSPSFAGWEVVNLDTIILAEKPKLAPHRLQIRESLAALLTLPLERVSVKAGTQEGLGAIGRGEGMAAHATVLLYYHST